jgi:hypothetical protein
MSPLQFLVFYSSSLGGFPSVSVLGRLGRDFTSAISPSCEMFLEVPGVKRLAHFSPATDFSWVRALYDEFTLGVLHFQSTNRRENRISRCFTLSVMPPMAGGTAVSHF